MRGLMFMLLAVTLGLAPTHAAEERSTIAVYVGVQAERQGDYVQPVPKELIDSVKDIQKRLRKYRGIKIVPTLETADAALYVWSRGWESEPTGLIAQRAGSGVVARETYANYAVVKTVLFAPNQFSQEIVGERGSWGASADDIAKEVATWIDANRATLIASRSTRVLVR